VKRNNNNSEGVDSNEQCSSNVKVTPDPNRTKCNSIAKIRKWETHISDTSSFCRMAKFWMYSSS